MGLFSRFNTRYLYLTDLVAPTMVPDDVLSFYRSTPGNEIKYENRIIEFSNLAISTASSPASLVGFVSGPGVITASDSILSAIEKLYGNALVPTTVSNTSLINTLTTTVNSITGVGVSIINSNVLSLLGSNLTSTINGVASVVSLSGLGWGLLGNAGTVDGVNFIGTTDNIPFNIRVNNQRAGRIDHLLFNNYFGYLAGNSNTTGTFNTAIGYQTLQTNSTGNFNTAVGYQALKNNTVVGNTAIGYNTLLANTTGSSNTAIGINALGSNTTGATNIGIGSSALYFNTTGTNNIAIGLGALTNNISSDGNVAIGRQALIAATGAGNIAIGYSAGNSITTGTSNIFIGNVAFGIGLTTGSNNTIIGPVSGLAAALSNNIILADGVGTIRQQFDNTGALSLTGPAITAVTLTTLNRSLTLTVNGIVYYIPASLVNA